MYAPDFGYLRARSVAEVGELLAAHPGAKLLAGGHSLIPLLKLRLAAPPNLIDIGRVAELRGITTIDGVIRIGALTPHADVAAAAIVREQAAALAEAAGAIGDPAVRNRGTIGGNVAHADPASDLPSVLLSLGATFRIVGPGGARTVPAADFFQGVMTTALGESDLLTAIEIPVRVAGQGSAYAKFVHPASRYAVIGASAAITIADGRCTAAVVAVGGLVPAPMRATHVERALVDTLPSAGGLAAAAVRVGDDLGDDVIGDVFASADYRRAVAHVWVRRAIEAAVERAA